MAYYNWSYKYPIKDLRGNPKTRVSPDWTAPDRTETSPGSGHVFEIFSGRVGSGIKILVRSGSGYFLSEYHIFFPRISKTK